MSTSTPASESGAGPLPPHDLVAEQAVLGAMMLSPEVVGEVTETVTVRDFYRPAHAAVYQVICGLDASGEPSDPVAVAAELDRRGELGRIGGAASLHTLIAAVPTAANAAYYAEIVAEKATLRRLVESGIRIQQLGHIGVQSGEISGVIDRARSTLDGVSAVHDDSAGCVAFGSGHAAWLAGLDGLQAGWGEPGLPSGLDDLDEVTGGWKPGQLIVIAARPGLGKSTLALDMVRAASVRHGKTSVIFSLEMSESEIRDKIIAAEARVRVSDLRTPHALDQVAYERITAAATRVLAGGELFIDDTATTTVSQIRAKARRVQARHGLDLIVVDYLQLMSSGSRVENRQVEVSDFSRQLKVLAKDFDVPVIALSQLNRGPEQRADKRPVLSDLRESGALEQDADIVILLHRPDAYDHNDPRAGEADLILAKNRGGPTRTIAVAHQLHYSRFAGLGRR
ncbi:replicative DNA helicase [Pseudonocardia sp. ICBG1293]|uniref:replicative DNA helicase n=1 Tax=Pseudonocardia sp. ICBG1293 TaxID=2844382 RepID=UPI001CCCCF71|nr:replicative DNA helicase [Pseudonocardia sp. ICBG1293]